MATAQRPLKEGSVRTYQEKVGLGFVDILASEMDADLDVIYAAWNGGVDSVTLKDLSVTTPKLADGAVTTPKLGDAAVTSPKLGSNLSLLGDLTVGAAGAPKLNLGLRCYLESWDGGYCSLYVNSASSLGYLVNENGWALRLSYLGANRYAQLMYRAPGTTTDVEKFQINAAGDLTVPGQITSTSGAIITATGSVTGVNLYASGTTTGLKCKGVGNDTGGGYSNSIAFGWNGTLQARVDATVIGTVTVTSDARVKQDVQEDVPGLTAVLALRPISFEYDQTKREIGFPAGRHYGLIAQEVEPHAPLVVEDDGSEEHWKELDYRLLVPVLVHAIQDLAARVALLEAPA